MKVIDKKNLYHKSNLEIDQIFGFKDYALELPDYPSNIFYTDGLTSAEALYSDYQDLLQIHTFLEEKKIKSFCDLGAGIGRAKILFDSLNSSFQSYSLEFVQQRHKEGKRVHKENQLSHEEGFIQCNLLTDPIPKCECYFIYLPVGEVLIKTMEKIKNLTLEEKCLIIAIESHGDLLSYLEKTHRHLSLRDRIPLSAKRHTEFIHIYEYQPKDNPSPLESDIFNHLDNSTNKDQPLRINFSEELSFWELWKELRKRDEFQVLVEDQNGQWLADLKDSQFGIQPSTLETQYPQRIIPLSEIKAFVRAPLSWQELIRKRRNKEDGPLGEIRKLIVFPSPQVEFSRGQKRELETAWDWELFTTLGV
jgi:hypothetical protein